MAEGTKKYEKTFDIILSSVDEAQTEALAPQLAKAFSLDPESAATILRSAPIVFLQGVAKPDVRTVKKHLLEISKSGAEFTITTQAAAELPRVIWAQRPKFGEAASGDLVHELRWDFGKNAFVCPGCGEAFLLRRIGPLAKRLTAATAAQPAATAAKPSAPAAPAKAAPAAASSRQGRSAPVDEPLEAVVPLESIEMLEKGSVEEGGEEALTPPPPARKGGKPAPAPARGKAPPPPKVEEAEELVEVEEAEELEPAVELPADKLSEDIDLGGEDEEAMEVEELATDSGEEVEELEEAEEEEAEEAEELEDIEEVEEAPRAPARGGRGVAASKEKEKSSVEKAPARSPARLTYPKPAAAKAAEEEEEEEKESGGGDDEGSDDVQFSVFLSRIPTPDKQSQAAKLISEIRGVSVAEAKELASRMVIPVLKDVSQAEAEKCLEKFKKIKISGRMTKKK